jgi:uncharacterized integral membrane protein
MAGPAKFEYGLESFSLVLFLMLVVKHIWNAIDPDIGS